MSKDRPRDPKDMKLAMVSVYGIACGIATYADYLWKELAPQFKEARLFCEYHASPPGPSDATECWSRGKPLRELVDALLEYDPDVVYVQHEYGHFPSGAHWLSFLSAMTGRRVIVTLHSVYEHLDKLVCEAACQEIVVHTEAARDCLRRKGVTAPVHVIPHGCNAPTYEPLWNIYRTKHTLLQFGFGLRYKSWETSLRVVAALKPEFPDVFFTGLMSRSPFSGTEADQYVEELHALAAELGIRENIALLQGFKSENVLDSFFRTNAVGIFPYKDNGPHKVYGCSGAARRAMALGLPIVTSYVPLFSDLDGVPRADTPIAFASVIKRLFSKEVQQAQRARQNEFLKRNSWENVAGQYANLVRNPS